MDDVEIDILFKKNELNFNYGKIVTKNIRELYQNNSLDEGKEASVFF
jgi:hypothetical protein